MINWTIDPIQAWMPNYQAYANSITDLVEALLQARAGEIEDWLKSNHKWRSKTGLAESGLTVTIIRDNLRIILIMYYNGSVFEIRRNGNRYYPYYLEQIWGGSRQFSVLAPALDYWGPVLVDDLAKALK